MNREELISQIRHEARAMEEPPWWPNSIEFHPCMTAVLFHVHGIDRFDMHAPFIHHEGHLGPIYEGLEQRLYDQANEMTAPPCWPTATDFNIFIYVLLLTFHGLCQVDEGTPLMPPDAPESAGPAQGRILFADVEMRYPRPSCWPPTVDFHFYMWALLSHLQGTHEFNPHMHLHEYSPPDPLLFELDILAYMDHLRSQLSSLEIPTRWPPNHDFHRYLVSVILNAQGIFESQFPQVNEDANESDHGSEVEAEFEAVWQNAPRVFRILIAWMVIIFIAYLFYWVDFTKFHLALPLEHDFILA